MNQHIYNCSHCEELPDGQHTILCIKLRLLREFLAEFDSIVVSHAFIWEKSDNNRVPEHLNSLLEQISKSKGVPTLPFDEVFGRCIPGVFNSDDVFWSDIGMHVGTKDWNEVVATITKIANSSSKVSRIEDFIDLFPDSGTIYI